MKQTKARALALLSGGLDSILAIKILQQQNIEVIAVNFSSPFFSEKKAIEAAKQLKVKLINIDLSHGKNFYEYLNVINSPKYGYGSAINPCINCHIFMLKKVRELMPKLEAKFIVTGDVLGERPMSQHLSALAIIEKESGLQGKLLRPLSAKLLPETISEKQGLVDRNKLLAIQGRSRQKQLELAKKFKLKFPAPGGGCILCEQEFSKKLRDLLKNKKEKDIEPRDIELLKVGRHFRYKNNKIIVGRNEKENKIIRSLANNRLIFEVKDIPSPITLLEGKTSKKSIETAASLTVAYSDAKNKNAIVNYGKRKLNKSLKVSPLSQKEIDGLRIK